MFLNLFRLYSCNFHSNLSCQLVTTNDKIRVVLSLYIFILEASGSNLGLVTVCSGWFFVPFLDFYSWHRIVWKVSTNVWEEHIVPICKRKFIALWYENYSSIFFTWWKILKIKSQQNVNLKHSYCLFLDSFHQNSLLPVVFDSVIQADTQMPCYEVSCRLAL
jgi:hypothetical protein